MRRELRSESIRVLDWNQNVRDGYLKGQPGIDWLIKRVGLRTGCVLSQSLKEKIRNLFAQRPLRELLSVHSEFLLETDNEDERLLGLVVQEAFLFYNFSVNFRNERKPMEVGLDPQILARMAQARERFRQSYAELEALNRPYWEEELPKFRGALFDFNRELASWKSAPKVSIAMISMVGRRFDALLRRMDEFNRIEMPGGIEVILTIADPAEFISEKHASFSKEAGAMRYPIRVIYAKSAVPGVMNSLTIDRNVASSHASGDYRVFLDDDVRLTGPVIENMILTLEIHPEFGIVSTANYTKRAALLKPVYPRKYFIEPHLMITDRVLGNITATRSEIVRVTPFNPLLRNLGDDQHLVRQILNLGFVVGYTLPDDAHAMDEDLGYSATRSNTNLARHLIEEGLKYYFSPDTYDEWQAAPAAFLMHRWSKQTQPQSAVFEFCGRFRPALRDFLDSQRSCFDFIKEHPDDPFIRDNIDELRDAVGYYAENKGAILAFKGNQYDAKNLSHVDPSRGPLILRQRVFEEPTEETEVLSLEAAASKLEFSTAVLPLIMDLFYGGRDPGDVLRSALLVPGVQRADFTGGILTMTGPGEVVKCHWKDAEINERHGLRDRFYLRMSGSPDRSIPAGDTLVAVKVYHKDFRDSPRPGGKPVYVLGVVRDGHDSVAALVKNGVLVGAIEEERLDLDKHTFVPFPREALHYLLSAHGLGWEDLDHIAVSFDYNIYRDTPTSRSPHYYYRRRHHLPFKESYLRFSTNYYQRSLEALAMGYGTGYIPPVTYVKHHKCHAASAYYASGFREPALVLTVDGQGEDESTAVWLAKDGKLKKLARTTPFTQSLGHFYHIFTIYLGYKRNDEGKVMGYAPYGAPRNASEERTLQELRGLMNELIRFNTETQQIEMNPEHFQYTKIRSFPWVKLAEQFERRIAKIAAPMPEGKGSELDPEDRGRAQMAFAMQERVEQVIEDMVTYYFTRHPETKGLKHLILAGGLALNISANGRLIEKGMVDADKLFVPPYPADDGTAIGAALSVANEEYALDVHHEIKQTSFGRVYSDAEIETALTRFGLKEGTDYVRLPDDAALVRETASVVAGGQTVAWFQGGSELGPRALGNRSILNRLDDPGGNLKVNRIKRRELWRPSALSIQEEHAAEFLQGIHKSPFMTIAFPVTEGKRDVIKAGAHSGDGRTRPQTVSCESNLLFWSLLGEIGRLTGVPGVLNTSFNRRGPIVETPEDALNTFYYCEGLDALVIGRYMLVSRAHLVPSLLQASDETTLRAHFDTGGSKSAPLSPWWDRFWDDARALVIQRAPHQHWLAFFHDTGRSAREILRVPLIKEMFQVGTREFMIRDLMARIERELGSGAHAVVSVETTASQFVAVVLDLFQRITPAAATVNLRLTNLALLDAPLTGREGYPLRMNLSELLVKLNSGATLGRGGARCGPMLIALTGTVAGVAGALTQSVKNARIIDGSRWVTPNGAPHLPAVFSEVSFEAYASALTRLGEGRNAMIPIGEKTLESRPPQGFVMALAEQQARYASRLIKPQSRLWIRHDGALFEELVPETSDVLAVINAAALDYPVVRRVFDEICFARPSEELDTLSAVADATPHPLTARGFQHASVLVESDKVRVKWPHDSSWIPLRRPEAVRGYAYIAINLTNYCPIECPFCFMHADPNKNRSISLSAEAIDRVLVYAGERRMRHIQLGGGEPLAELDSVSKILRGADVETIGLFTSGYFATNPARTEQVLDVLARALDERARLGRKSISFTLTLSIDEFHSRVPDKSLLLLIRTMDAYREGKYHNITLELKGILMSSDPIPGLIETLGGTIDPAAQPGNYPVMRIKLPSGYQFSARYGEVKLMDEMIDTDLGRKGFHKGYEARLKAGERLIETEDVHLSVSYDGVTSLHEYIVKDLRMGNAYEETFAADIDRRLLLDPLAVAPRKYRMKTIFDIAARIRPKLIQRSIQANNNFLAVSYILQDEALKDYVYRELIKRIEPEQRTGPAADQGKFRKREDWKPASEFLLSGTPWIPLHVPHPVHHFDNILVGITDYCPVQCDFCWMRATPRRGNANILNRAAIDRILEFINENNVYTLDLTGGEAVSEMKTVLRFIREAKVQRISLSTSGYFATSEAVAETYLDRMVEAMSSRDVAGLAPVAFDFRLSIDEYHKSVSLETLRNLLLVMERHHKSKYGDIVLEIRGMQTAGDPLDSLIRSLAGTMSDHPSHPFPMKRIRLASGFAFDAKYQEVKLDEDQLVTELAERDFARGWRNRVQNDRIFIGTSNLRGAYVFIDWRGSAAPHAFLSNKFTLTNLNKPNFASELYERLTRDPLVVALRELGLKTVLDIASQYRSTIRERSIKANNMFLAVTDIIEDEPLRNYVYQELIRRLEVVEVVRETKI